MELPREWAQMDAQQLRDLTSQLTELDAVQRSLLDESIDADIEAISLEIEALREKPVSTPKSEKLHERLPTQPASRLEELLPHRWQ